MGTSLRNHNHTPRSTTEPASLLAAAVTLLAGCSGAWRPPMEAVREARPPAAIDMLEYTGQATTETLLLRTDLRKPDAPPTPYRQQARSGRHLEGAFFDEKPAPLDECRVEGDQPEPRRYLRWPVSGERRWLGLLMEFTPPLIYLPQTIHPENPAESESAIKVFDRWGHTLYRGTIRRTVRMEGYEDVTADGAVYQACLRLAAETRIRLDWGPRVNVTEYFWLARGQGEVKRVRHTLALALLFFIDEAYSYERAAEQPRGPDPDTAPLQPALAWSRVALLLDPFLPRVGVGGMVVEFSAP